jgi:hypothetical protein
MPRKPRIITETVAFLRELAGIIRSKDGVVHIAEADSAEQMADKLDAYDARETKKDPSKRKAKKPRARR